MLQDAHLDLVMQTVKSHKEDTLQDAVWESRDWCHMYHLSYGRTQLLSWLPLKKTDRVLEIGAECGALTGFLAGRCAQVMALEWDAYKSSVNQERNGENGNITFLTGNLEEQLEALKGIEGNQEDQIAKEGQREQEISIKQGKNVDAEGKTEFTDKYPTEVNVGYDWIFLIGSLPLAEQYLPTAPQTQAYAQLLSIAADLLSENGHLVAALPNKLGLKYFAGCREDYFGAPFTSVEDYHFHKGMRTFAKRELAELLKESGFEKTDWYYPYPDYRFANMIYSDAYLPHAGELHTNLCNYDQERYVFFDETKAFDTLIKEGLFGEMANSFLVIAGKEKQDVCDLPSYMKFSAERKKEFAIRTEILGSEGNYRVKKSPLFEEGWAHTQSLSQKAESLNACFAPVNIAVRAPEVFIEGQSLQEIMECLVMQKKFDEVTALLKEYQRRILSAATGTFEKTKDFIKIFGDADLPDGLMATEVSDIDLIFSNLFAGADKNKWTAIDYEWTFFFPVPVHFVLYRAYFFAHHQITSCEPLELPKLWALAGIDEHEIAAYEQMERHFQQYVLGDKKPERDMLGRIGNGIVPLAELDAAYREKIAINQEKTEANREKTATKCGKTGNAAGNCEKTETNDEKTKEQTDGRKSFLHGMGRGKRLFQR